jgi:hypothetical protein
LQTSAIFVNQIHLVRTVMCIHLVRTVMCMNLRICRGGSKLQTMAQLLQSLKQRLNLLQTALMCVCVCGCRGLSRHSVQLIRNSVHE